MRAAESLKRHPLPYLLAATLLLYFVSLNAPFVFDDLDQIPLNSALHSLTSPLSVVFNGHRQARVLVNMSYAIDWVIGGGRTWPFHLTNILIHLFNGWLLFRLFSRHLKSRPLVLLMGTALFLLHPLQIQSVTYISGRISTIQCAFYLASLELYAVGRQRLNVGLFAVMALSLLAKESCGFIPLALAAYALTIGGQSPRQFFNKANAPMLSILVLAWPVHSVFEETVSSAAGTVGFGLYPVVEYTLTNGYYHLFNAALLFMPAWQSLIHEHPAFTTAIGAAGAGAWCLIFGLLGALWKWRRRCPFGAFLAFFYAVSAGPTASIVQFINPFAEYRLYQQNIALFFGLALALEWVAKRLRSTAAAAWLGAGLIVIFVLNNAIQQRLWNDKRELYRYALEAYPRSYLLHLDLAKAYVELGDPEYGLVEFLEAERTAAALGAKYELGPRFSAALVLLRLRRPTEALSMLKAAPVERFLRGYPAPGFYALEYKLLDVLGKRVEAGRLIAEARSHYPGLDLVALAHEPH